MDMRFASPAAEDTRQTLAVIRPNVLVHVLRFAEHRGIDCRAWFAGLGLDRDTLFDPHARLSYRQVRTILTRAIEACGDAGLGLTVGASENLSVFGLLGLLMMTSDTFGDAVRQGVANHEVSGSLLDMEYEAMRDGHVALVLWPRFDDAALQPFLCEEMIASSLQVARELVGPAFRIARVDLAYAAPAYAKRYATVLDTETRFDAGVNRIILDAHWLTMPLPGSNPLAARQALEFCQRQRSDEESEQEVVVAVERLLRSRCRERLRIEQVAEILNLSARSLRRRLTDAGSSFRDIHDHVRAECAMEMLRGSREPMAQVASALGFSDAREFRRAFKRWTGVTPHAARTGRTSGQIGRFATPLATKQP